MGQAHLQTAWLDLTLSELTSRKGEISWKVPGFLPVLAQPGHCVVLG
jgi:hypothetical protein